MDPRYIPSSTNYSTTSSTIPKNPISNPQSLNQNENQINSRATLVAIVPRLQSSQRHIQQTTPAGATALFQAQDISSVSEQQDSLLIQEIKKVRDKYYNDYQGTTNITPQRYFSGCKYISSELMRCICRFEKSTSDNLINVIANYERERNFSDFNMDVFLSAYKKQLSSLLLNTLKSNLLRLENTLPKTEIIAHTSDNSDAYGELQSNFNEVTLHSMPNSWPTTTQPQLPLLDFAPSQQQLTTSYSNRLYVEESVADDSSNFRSNAYHATPPKRRKVYDTPIPQNNHERHDGIEQPCDPKETNNKMTILPGSYFGPLILPQLPSGISLHDLYRYPETYRAVQKQLRNPQQNQQ